MGNFDEFFPFNLGYGAPANTTRWRKMAQLWCPDGVFQGYLNQLNATLAGSTVTVQTGGVFMHGYYAEIVNSQAITVGTNGTVVAKVDLVNQICLIYYKDLATDYGGSSGYEQSANNWEIPLWLVNGTTLTDLRTMVNPGQGCGWWGQGPTSTSIPSGQTSQINFLAPRVPYAGQALLSGSLSILFTNANAAQSAICTLTYQFGSADQAVTPAITTQTIGNGAAGTTDTRQIAVSGLVTVGQGKKSVGWRITAGTGPTINAQILTASMMLLSLPTVG